MTEEVQYRHSNAPRTPSRYVSQAFGFLNTYDEDVLHVTDASDEFVETVVAVERLGAVNRFVKRFENGNVIPKSNGDSVEKLEDAMEDEKATATDSVDKYAENQRETKVTHNVSEETFETSTQAGPISATLFEINPVYDVTDDYLHGLGSKPSEISDTGTVVDTDIHKQDQINDRVDVILEETEPAVRHSVIVEGDEVELRQSPPGKRCSRRITWKVNQNIVSEAFGFLKDEINSGIIESVDNDLTNEHIDNLEQSVSDSDRGNVDVEIQSGESLNISADASGDIVDALDEQDDNSVNENDKVGELKEVKRRGRRKRSNQSDSSNEDEGDSSDDDKGI